MSVKLDTHVTFTHVSKLARQMTLLPCAHAVWHPLHCPGNNQGSTFVNLGMYIGMLLGGGGGGGGDGVLDTTCTLYIYLPVEFMSTSV